MGGSPGGREQNPCRTKAPASASSSRCLCLRINSLQAVSLALPPGLEALGEERSPGTAGMAGALPDGALQALARRAGALRPGRASSQTNVARPRPVASPHVHPPLKTWRNRQRPPAGGHGTEGGMRVARAQARVPLFRDRVCATLPGEHACARVCACPCVPPSPARPRVRGGGPVRPPSLSGQVLSPLHGSRSPPFPCCPPEPDIYILIFSKGGNALQCKCLHCGCT